MTTLQAPEYPRKMQLWLAAEFRLLNRLLCASKQVLPMAEPVALNRSARQKQAAAAGLGVRTATRIAATSAGTELPREYHRLFWAWFAFGFPAFAAVVAIFWLMISRPQSLI